MTLQLDVQWRYRDALQQLCAKHVVAVQAFAELTARHGEDANYGRHFRLQFLTSYGAICTNQYLGLPVRRMRCVRP